MKIIQILERAFTGMPAFVSFLFVTSFAVMFTIVPDSPPEPRKPPLLNHLNPKVKTKIEQYYIHDEDSAIYAGRFDSVNIPKPKFEGESSTYKYLWNGTPRHRQWLTYNEWRGKHCRSNKQRKAFKKWKKREMDSFIDYMCIAAIDESKVFPDIPPELIVAQAILESNFGKSRLAVEGNNLFGHKYRGKDKHLFIIAADDSPNDRFTKYRSLWFSIRNHTKLLMKKYRNRISHQPTLGRWLYALCGGMTVEQSKRWRVKGNSVYATSCMTEVCYSQKLRNVINVYSLTERCSKIK